MLRSYCSCERLAVRQRSSQGLAFAAFTYRVLQVMLMLLADIQACTVGKMYNDLTSQRIASSSARVKSGDSKAGPAHLVRQPGPARRATSGSLEQILGDRRGEDSERCAERGRMSSASVDGIFKRHGWDFLATGLLLISAYLLAHIGSRYAFHPYFHYGYYHYGYSSSYYEEGVYFERLRVIVCAAWLLAACRFYVLHWYLPGNRIKYLPTTVGIAFAWLFNPIFPVTMTGAMAAR